VPSGPVEQKYGVASRLHVLGDLIEMQLHRLSVALGQDKAGRLAVLRTDRAEDVGRGGALVARRGRTCSAPGPAAGDLVLLADARLVGKPDLYGVKVDAFLARDFLHARGETFLKSSIAWAACA